MLDDPLIRRTLLTAIVAIPAGYAIGAIVVVGTREPLRETVEVRTVPTDDELLARCEALIPEGTHERLKQAVAEVSRLEGQLVEKERELALIEQSRVDNEAARKELETKRRMLQAEVKELRRALTKVAVERDELLVELKETVEALDAQVEETERQRTEKERWRQVSTDEAWSRFVAESKIALCDRGTRKRQDRCESHLEAFFGRALEERFQNCLLTGQATPTLGQLEDPDARLPPAAVAVPEDRSIPGRGYYVVLCDQDLPESTTDGVVVERDEPSLEEALDGALDALSNGD